MDLSQTDRHLRTKRGPISEETRKYRDSNNLCRYCGGAGHWRSNCPLNQKPKKLNAATDSSETQPLYEAKN